MRRITFRVLIAVITLIIGIAAAYVWIVQSLPPLTDIPEVSRPALSEIQPHSERDSSLGWDLTYISLLEKNNVARSEIIWNWLNAHPQSPAGNWISGWQGEPIVSSILFEIPMPHAAARGTLWLVRTKEHAYYCEFVEKCAGCKPRAVENVWAVNVKKDVPLPVYDELFAEVSSWQQAESPAVKEPVPDLMRGYAGFLSLYEQGESRQLLLTLEEIFGQKDSWPCDTEECRRGKMGKVFRVLLPVI